MFFIGIVFIFVSMLDCFTIVDLSLKGYSKEDLLDLEGLVLDSTSLSTMHHGWNFTGCSLYDQTHLGIKAPELVAHLGLDKPEWNQTKFLEPSFTIQGRSWGFVSKQFYAPKDSSVMVKFTLLLEGYKKDENSSKFLKTNMDFKLSFMNSTGAVMESVHLDALRATNREWKTMEAVFRKTSVGSEPFTVEFGLLKASEDQHLILSDVSVSWNPIVGENITREDLPDTLEAGNTTSSTLNITTTTDSTAAALSNNTIDATTTPSINMTANATSFFANITTSPTPTKNGSASADTMAKMDGSIGYNGEVLLICLVVILGIVVLVLTANYYLVKKNIGDYRVNGAREAAAAQYSNPSFNQQESYRDH